jgi:plastin-1
MHIVGIQGADIVDGTRTLVLGLVWQMMRQNVTQTLASLSKGGKEVTDADIVRWANDTVRKAGKSSSMRSFKDPANKNAVFFLDLLDAMKPGYVDYSLVMQGRNDEECKNNGKEKLPRFPALAGRLNLLFVPRQPNWPFRLRERWDRSYSSSPR